jgi:hypothetical protein
MTEYTEQETLEHFAREAIGDLSSAEPGQLVCLYDACVAAEWAWQAGHNMPRAGAGRRDQTVPDILEKECERCCEMRRLIIAEIHRRGAMDNEYDEADRCRILVAWYQESGHDDQALYAEILQSLELSHVRNRAA